MVNDSIWIYFSDADLVVKTVMLILLGMSFLSWLFIFQRHLYLNRITERLSVFEDKFWRTRDLTKLYSQLSSTQQKRLGLERVFDAGFKEYLALSNKNDLAFQWQLQGVQRAMRVATTKEVERLEKHLSFLASVGSISPYIGLFGTVWGIMTAFQALSHVQQASIAMVAPGISEALIATALGLFAAIPAVLAYNNFSSKVDTIINQFEVFQDEFSSLLLRQSS